MSQTSEVRRRRKLKRGIGKERMTRKRMLDLIAARTMKRLIAVVGRENVSITQDTSFSLVLETSSDQVERILLEEGYIKAHSGEFVHKKMRLSDFVGVGGMVSLKPMFQPPISKGLQELRMKPEYIFDPQTLYGGDKHRLADIDVSLSYPTLPKVSEEEVNKVAERLSSTDAVRF